MHHLINEYRPVQARDTLRQMIINQNTEIRDVTTKLEKYMETGKEALANLRKSFDNITLDVPKRPQSCIEPTIIELEEEDF